MNQDSRTRSRLRGWLLKLVCAAAVSVTAYWLARYGLRCSSDVSWLVGLLGFVTAIAFTDALWANGVVSFAAGVVWMTFGIAPDVYGRGHISSLAPWITAVILIPAAAYGVGRLIKSRRPLPSNN